MEFKARREIDKILFSASKDNGVFPTSMICFGETFDNTNDYDVFFQKMRAFCEAYYNMEKAQKKGKYIGSSVFEYIKKVMLMDPEISDGIKKRCMCLLD
ncbi:hypothetical protein FACS189450_10680 [Spirochaetia bacterium]|nr:hypothetical protein FACS189450_10680 [Spirochaetia bacterium]